MLCPGCDKTVSKNDAVCPLCGYKLKSENVEAEITQTITYLAAKNGSAKKKIPLDHNKKVDSMTPEEKRKLSVFMDTHNGMTPEEYERQQNEAAITSGLGVLLAPSETGKSTKTPSSTGGSTSQSSGASRSSSGSSGRSSSSGTYRSTGGSSSGSTSRSTSSTTYGGSSSGGTSRSTSSTTYGGYSSGGTSRTTSGTTYGSTTYGGSTSSTGASSRSVSTPKKKSKDRGNFLLNLLCCIFPFMGIFYGMSATSYYPNKARSAVVSSIFGVVLYVAVHFFLLYGTEIEQVSIFIKELGIR